MRTILSIFVLLNLTACSILWPTPVSFPTAPKQLMEPPKDLKIIPLRDPKSPPIKLSEVTEIIIENYNASNENSTKLKSLQEWITDQEAVFNK